MKLTGKSAIVASVGSVDLTEAGIALIKRAQAAARTDVLDTQAPISHRTDEAHDYQHGGGVRARVTRCLSGT
jgi:hypothetical protein